MSFRRVGLSLLAVVVTGCGGHRAFVSDVTPTLGTMRFVDAVASPATAPGLAPSAVVFRSAKHGFIATTGGGWEIPKTGWASPLTAARIQETKDGGATWRTVWSARNVALQQLVFAGRSAFALGVRSRIGSQGLSAPRVGVAVASADGGRRWSAARAPAGLVTVVSAGSSWYAFGRGRLVRLDAPFGRWRRVAAPPALGTAVAFATRSTGFAAGRCAGGEQLWRTVDAARTWTPIAGTCGQSYSSLEADAHAYVAVQGAAQSVSGPSFQVVRRSFDGGRTWPLAGRPIRFPEVTATHFTDSRHGWAVVWGSSQGFFDSGLWRTGDGGRTWTRSAVPAPPTAFAGTDAAWAVDGMNDVVWRTADGGRTWSAATSPRLVAVFGIDTATQRGVVVDTTLGTLASAGGRWHAARKPAVWSGGLARVRQAGPGTEMTLTVVGRRVALPPRAFTVGGAWFTSARDGVVAGGDISGGDTRAAAWATRDGGRSWRRVRLPPTVNPADEAALGPDALAVVDQNGLYVTADAGSHWARLPGTSPNGICSISRPAKAIWVLCGGAGLYRSRDGGRTWSASTGGGRLDGPMVAATDDEAWALGRSRAFLLGRQLWHTTDGGRTWRRVGVTTAPTAPVGFRLPPHSLTP